MQPKPTILPARVIALGWFIISAAFTPPTLVISSERGGTPPIALVFLGVAASFLPWALATRPILRLCRSAPLGAGEGGGPLLKLALGGLVALPLLAFAGTILNQASVSLFVPGAPAFLGTRLVGPAMLNAMYMTPVYVMIVGVGQTMLHVDRTRARDRALTRARFEALRAQVDPHFLFNVLNAVAALTHRDADRADDALAKLAGILRRTLVDDRESVPLADEIETLREEVDLYRLLVPGDVDLVVTVSSDAARALVPALLLRPLVENAMTHGITCSRGGTLEIEALVEEGNLHIGLTNTSSGRNTPGTGLGLANVADRLHQHYGACSVLTAGPGEHLYCVHLRLPTQYAGAA